MKSDEHKVNRFLILEQIALRVSWICQSRRVDLKISVCKGKSPHNYSTLIKQHRVQYIYHLRKFLHFFLDLAHKWESTSSQKICSLQHQEQWGNNRVWSVQILPTYFDLIQGYSPLYTIWVVCKITHLQELMISIEQITWFWVLTSCQALDMFSPCSSLMTTL